MEKIKKSEYLELEPAGCIQFYLPSSKVQCTSILELRNKHSRDIFFKVKTSSQKCFLVQPIQSCVKIGAKLKVHLTYLFSEDSVNTVQKLLIIAVPGVNNENLAIDWGKDSQEYKIEAKIKIIQDKDEQNQEIQAEISETMNEIEKLEADIAKNKKKIKESNDLDYITKEKLEKFNLSHLLAFALGGFCIGIIVCYFIN